MRRNFAQILKDAKIDIKAEYQKLYGLLFDRSIQVSNTKRISAYDELSDYFIYFGFRGTCLSIDEFNDVYGFHFERDPKDFDIDYLVSLCEYTYNMLMGYQCTNGNGMGYGYMVAAPINIQFYVMQIQRVIEAIGYMQSNQDGFVIFVEKSPEAIAVAESELIPDKLSYKIIAYNHYAMKGNIEAKKAVLLQLASILEGKRDVLKAADGTLERNLFYLFNNLNIRHNNIDSNDSAKYKQYVAHMPQEEIEEWYDEIYRMCLLAFLQIEHFDRRNKLNTLKNNIENGNAN